MGSFSADVGAWVRETEARMTAVFRESSQRVIERMQRTAPVDTGFLRASLQVAVNAPLPTANRPRPEGSGFQSPSYSAVIAGARLGDYITAGYGALYAPYLEFGANGRAPVAWVRGAAEQWPVIVAQVAAEARSRAG
jgi:hypothetical protein